MQVQFTARHMELTEALKSHTQAKLEKLKRYMDLIVEAQVTLSVEKYRHKAEITIKGKKTTVWGMEVSGDMYQSIDKVFEKLEKQLRRKKDRRIAKRTGRADEVILGDFEIEETEDEAIQASDIVRRELENIIVETRELESKPMSLEEALMQFKGDSSEFFVFRDSQELMHLNFLYRRLDGKLGLIRTR